MNTKIWELIIYKSNNGELPFEKWLGGLRDFCTQAVIEKRLNRIRAGNFGDVKSLGLGVYELRVDYGAGYRIYYAIDEDKIILLLLGGNKSTQARDIHKAKKYWRDYLLRK